MLKRKLNWRRLLFYLLLPILFIMVFLGFPLPVAPPPAIKSAQEISTTVKKKKRVRLSGPLAAPDDEEMLDEPADGKRRQDRAD